MMRLTVPRLFPPALLALAATAPVVAADFTEAVDISRAAAPADHTLMQVELRDRDGMTVYQADLFPAGAATEFEVRIDPTTGEVIEVDMGVPDPSEQAEVLAVFDRWDEVQIDFADAIAIVQEVDAESALEKIQLDVEDGLVIYQLELIDASGQDIRYYVNATSGAIHDGNDGDDETAANEAFAMAISVAAELTGGVPLEAEAEGSDGPLHIEVMTYDVTTELITDVDVAADTGEVLSTSTYEAGPSQAERIDEILALLPDANVTFEQALATASEMIPGGATHEIELRVEDIGLVYEVELILNLMEVEVQVSATSGDANTASSTWTAPADFNGDGAVAVADLLELVGMWQSVNPHYDIDASGDVDVSDLLMLLEAYGD